MNLHFVYVLANSDQRSIWTSVVNDDEYRVPALQEDDIVLDIGMHTGSFVARAYVAGSRRIYGFEPDEDNFRLAQANVGGLGQLFQAAIVRSDSRKDDAVFLSPHIPMEHELNTGVGNIFAEGGQQVPTVPLDEILGGLKDVRLVKLDCEGGEWPALYTSKYLSRVQEFVGEWHLTMPEDFAEAQGVPPCTLTGLSYFMERQGFSTHFMARAEDLPGPLAGNFRFASLTRTSADYRQRLFDADLAGGRVTLCASGY